MDRRRLWATIFWCMELASIIFLFVTYLWWDVSKWIRWLVYLVLLFSTISLQRVCRCPFCGRTVMINPIRRDPENVYCSHCGNKVW